MLHASDIARLAQNHSTELVEIGTRWPEAGVVPSVSNKMIATPLSGVVIVTACGFAFALISTPGKQLLAEILLVVLGLLR